MLWVLIKDSIPAKALVLIALAVIFWFFGLTSLFTIVLIIVVELLISRTSHNTDLNEFIYSKDIMALFVVENSQLRVGMEKGNLDKIKHINLWQEDQHGFVDFMLNTHFRVRYKFSMQQYQAFRQWIQQVLPDSQIIDGFKS